MLFIKKSLCHGVPLSLGIILATAKNLAKEHEKDPGNITRSWLEEFSERHSISGMKLWGEGVSCDVVKAKIFIKENIPLILKGKSDQQI